MTRKLGGPLGLDWIHLGRVSAGATDREMAVSFLVPQVHLISAPVHSAAFANPGKRIFIHVPEYSG